MTWKHSLDKLLERAYPGRPFSTTGNTIDDIIVHDDGPFPTQPDLDAADIALTALDYQTPRRREYAKVEDWLDQIWHDIDNGTLNKNGVFYANRLAIKTQYPK